MKLMDREEDMRLISHTDFDLLQIFAFQTSMTEWVGCIAM
jgi:hypothetical protein